MAAFNMTAMRTALHHPCRLQQKSTPVSRSTAPAVFAPLTSLNSGLRRRIEPGRMLLTSMTSALTS